MRKMNKSPFETCDLMPTSPQPLQSVSEAIWTFEDTLAPICLLVAHAEVEGENGEESKDSELATDGSPETGDVSRVVGLSVDERSEDTSNTWDREKEECQWMPKNEVSVK